MIKVCLLLLSLILSGCSSTALLAPTPTPAPQPTLTLIPTQAPDRTTETETWDEVFANTIYHRLEVDDTIPEPGRQATIRMIAGQPTALLHLVKRWEWQSIGSLPLRSPFGAVSVSVNGLVLVVPSFWSRIHLPHHLSGKHSGVKLKCMACGSD